jgi:hypothetical protein
MTVLTAKLPIDTDPLAHCNPSCDIDITVAPFRMCTKFLLRLFKQDLNTLPGDPFGLRVAGFLFHRLVIYSLMW